MKYCDKFLEEAYLEELDAAQMRMLRAGYGAVAGVISGFFSVTRQKKILAKLIMAKKECKDKKCRAKYDLWINHFQTKLGFVDGTENDEAGGRAILRGIGGFAVGGVGVGDASFEVLIPILHVVGSVMDRKKIRDLKKGLKKAHKECKDDACKKGIERELEALEDWLTKDEANQVIKKSIPEYKPEKRKVEKFLGK